MKSILISILLLVSYDLIACDCESIPKIDKKSVANAEDIFIGKVIKIETNDNHSRKITFQISQRLKIDSTAQISVFTGLGGADCGLNIKEGQEWYIFASNFNGKAWAGLCSRSALLSEHSIPPNSYRKKYYREAIQQYKRNKARALSEIEFIHELHL